ncbi:MAG: methyltransferase domain-containing protein [Chlamydiales bacterium]|nr:methyltransferase domain-containing protein [Chlamydiales bacterium]
MIKWFWVYLAVILPASCAAVVDQYPTEAEAEFYDCHSTPQWHVAEEALSTLDLAGTESILDIGCGSGKITANIAGRLTSGRIVGLDASQGMISYATSKYVPYYKNLSFVLGNALSLTHINEYDLIVSFNSVHWMAPHEELFTRVYDALMPGGRILFTSPCPADPKAARALIDTISSSEWAPYFKTYKHPRSSLTLSRCTELLAQIGFQDIEVMEQPFTHSFVNKSNVADWLAGFSAVLLFLPTDRQTEFLRQLVERYIHYFPLQLDGQVIYHQSELVIKASK